MIETQATMQGANGSFNFLHFQLLFVLCILAAGSFALQMGETCSSNASCDTGLHCETCIADGSIHPRCTRIQPVNPTSKVKGLPFNRYSWLTTHNSFSLLGAKSETGSPLITQFNQEDSVTSQLNNGVRGFMLDMYDFLNDIWLCHSFGGNCYNFTAFQPAINVLKEIEVFLSSNPSEIVTIFIEDYVTSPKGLSNLFNASGLRNYLFPLSRMPRNGSDWPTVDAMVAENQRLVVFTSQIKKEETEGIAYNWKYVVENQYGDGGMKPKSCPNRAESPALDTQDIKLFIQNYFPSNPNVSHACVDNSGPLNSMMSTCYSEAGNRWPNFIAVDFYQRSNGGGAPEAVDKAGGRLICGCDSVAFCVTGAPFGTCDVAISPTSHPPVDAPTSPTSFSQNTADAGRTSRLLRWWLSTTMAALFFLHCW